MGLINDSTTIASGLTTYAGDAGQLYYHIRHRRVIIDFSLVGTALPSGLQRVDHCWPDGCETSPGLSNAEAKRLAVEISRTNPTNKTNEQNQGFVVANQVGIIVSLGDTCIHRQAICSVSTVYASGCR